MQEGQTRIKGKHAYEHACLRGKRRRQDNGGSFTASDDNSSHARRVTSGACEEEDTLVHVRRRIHVRRIHVCSRHAR